MKWQVLLVSIAAVFAFALGTSRWKARLTASSDLTHDARDGGWTFVYGDTAGLRLQGPSGSSATLPGFEKLGYQVGAFDVTPDLSRVAYVDQYNYSRPQLKVVPSHRVERPLAIAQGASGTQYQCPLFDADGSVLFLRNNTSSTQGWSMERLYVPEHGGHVSSTTARVALDVAPSADDCFEESADGETLAWLGTDHEVHLARRAADGFRPAAHWPINGSYSFELAPSGAWIAVMDGSRLVTVDAATGKRTEIAPNAGAMVLAVSPDSEWIAVEQPMGLSGGGVKAFRVRDGVFADVNLSTYSSYDSRRKVWIARNAGSTSP